MVRNLDFEHLWAGTGAGRCNPNGIKRLYLSVEKETAQAEFEYYVKQGGEGVRQLYGYPLSSPASAVTMPIP